MKTHVIEFPQKSQKQFFLVILTLIVLTVIPLYLFDNPSLLHQKNPSPATFLSDNITTFSFSATNNSIEATKKLDEEDVVSEDFSETMLVKKCDLFKGEWIPSPEGPYYTNETCGEIYDHQNCLKFGKPDTGFLKWRWKPYDCELPRFSPSSFLKIVKGKSMAFVGDSMSRNQLQSLLCLLSSVPVEVSYLPDGKTKRWLYTNYNFTIVFFWSPHLVKTIEDDRPKGPLLFPLVNVYVDEFDDTWTNQIHRFDYVIISAAQWFWRPSVFYENGQVVGCFDCKDNNITDLTLFYGYKRAFKTAFRAFNQNFKGMTFLRSYSPGHFDNGAWNEGGTCTRTRPYTSNETKLEGFGQQFYLTQLEEFMAAAQGDGKKRGLKFRLLDTTQAMLLRPDGHPGRYGYPPEEKRTTSDCVHWCLPGPTDTWNELLLHMLKMESERPSDVKD
ncbi:hypothetical protein NE237_020642 [Protea cynaroides]|uniref:Trichome birefringence-like N-terminal domain-containing protein n=1 Tax=Protea cynaroides TaxID=273540 RepID=A0A9Q0HAZ0_9MAGN|nr:hypothetical protein NE237_020642 [Protea cynaroides]